MNADKIKTEISVASSRFLSASIGG